MADPAPSPHSRGDSCTPTTERQSTGLHGPGPATPGCRALQLAGRLPAAGVSSRRGHRRPCNTEVSLHTPRGGDEKMKTAPFQGYVRAAALLAGCALLGGSGGLPYAYAHDGDGGEETRAMRGFEIAPAPLNLRGKDRHLVGLGSYLVNAVGSCNMCHSAGPATEFTATGNPYF